MRNARLREANTESALLFYLDMVDCCMTEFLYFLQCTARRQRPVEDWCKFVNGLAFHLRTVNCKCSNPPNRSTYRRLFSMAKEKEKLDKNHVFLFLSYFLSFVSSKNLDGYFKKCVSNYSHSRTEYKYNPKGKRAINIRSQASQLYQRDFFSETRSQMKSSVEDHDFRIEIC